MLLFKETDDLRSYLGSLNTKIGFIPTMGSLHNGHLSLIESCKREGHIAVCSIFVNPTQFNQMEDFEKYPREINNDIELLVNAGCDVLFHPESNHMYPNGFQALPVDYGVLTHTLEGHFRPGHFDGVITIVGKLLEAVNPQHLYMGQKDYQQCAVIRHLLRLSFPEIIFHTVDTMREESGLAMSSRNARLSESDKEKSLQIFKVLQWIKSELFHIPLVELKAMAIERLSAYLKPEYIEIVDLTTLEPLQKFSKGDQAVVLIAAWCGGVRLIDNLIIA